MDAQLHLRRGLGLALDDIACGRDDLRRAQGLFAAAGNRPGELVAAAALVQFVGIADDHYAGFEEAVHAITAATVAIDDIADPDQRMLARTGALVAGWYRALDDPLLGTQAEALLRQLGDTAVAPAVRCCAGLAALAYFDAHIDLERVLWLELAMRPVLAAPDLGARLVAEWQHALVQALYQCGAPLQAEAARARHDATSAVCPPAIALKRALLEAQLAIGDGRIEPGRAALARAEPLLGPLAPRQASWWHLLRSRLCLIEGRHNEALTHARLALRLAGENHYPERWNGVTVMQEGQIHMATGAALSAVPFFERAGRAARGSQADFCWCLAHLARALAAFDAGGDDNAARAELATGLALARALHWQNFFRASPHVAARVCALALEHEIETAFVRELIVARGLDAVRPDLAAWPWPIRVRVLGRFRIDIDAVPLSFSGKVARKPLELLQFVVASGGSDVSVATVMFALWRDLEGDNARSAFNVALHRLRKLLAHDDALVLELGRLSLNPRRVWVDCLAFEQLVDTVGLADPLPAVAAQAARRAVAMYGGHFLNDTEDEPWQLVCRSRLASKFKRTVGQLARHGLAQGDTGSVRGLLERAIELDPLAEDLVRALMQLLIESGEQAAALDVFGRCRVAIAQALAAKPAAATMALVERIRAMG